MLNENTLLNSLKDLINDKKTKDVLIQGLKLLKPSVSRIILLLICFIILFLPILNIVASTSTLEIFQSIIEMSSDIIKDLFGIIFTGYALFQALIGVNALKQMLINKIGKHSSFKAYNLYFFIISIMYISIILFNYLLRIIFKSINTGYVNNCINCHFKNIIEFLFIIIYIEINIFAMCEIKSFLINMYHCFNMSVFSEGIEILNKNKEKDNQNNKSP